MIHIGKNFNLDNNRWTNKREDHRNLISTHEKNASFIKRNVFNAMNDTTNSVEILFKN